MVRREMTVVNTGILSYYFFYKCKWLIRPLPNSVEKEEERVLQGTHARKTHASTGTQNDPTHQGSKQREPQSHKGTLTRDTHNSGRRDVNNTTPDPAPVNTPHRRETEPMGESPHNKGETRPQRNGKKRSHTEKRVGNNNIINHFWTFFF